MGACGAWRACIAFAIIGFGIAACHQPEQPTVPPRPTNPTNTQALALRELDVIDASIVSEGGGRLLDAALPPLGASASVR